MTKKCRICDLEADIFSGQLVRDHTGLRWVCVLPGPCQARMNENRRERARALKEAAS